jgi:hypothetical protein
LKWQRQFQALGAAVKEEEVKEETNCLRVF